MCWSKLGGVAPNRSLPSMKGLLDNPQLQIAPPSKHQLVGLYDLTGLCDNFSLPNHKFRPLSLSEKVQGKEENKWCLNFTALTRIVDPYSGVMYSNY